MQRIYSFLFSSPVGRLVFLCRFLIVLFCSISLQIGAHRLLILLLLSDLAEAPDVHPLFSHSWLSFLIYASLVPALLGAAYMIFAVAIPRLVSIGISKWFAPLLFVPYARYLFLLFLLFCPPQAFHRRLREEEMAD
jgi:hypothetical protein